MRLSSAFESSVLLVPVTESTHHIMDTAEEDEMRRALMQQGVLLGRHQEEISASWRAYSEISLQLNQLVERVDQLHTIPPAAPYGNPSSQSRWNE